jgi:hypothetical protein
MAAVVASPTAEAASEVAVVAGSMAAVVVDLTVAEATAGTAKSNNFRSSNERPANLPAVFFAASFSRALDSEDACFTFR